MRHLSSVLLLVGLSMTAACTSAGTDTDPDSSGQAATSGREKATKESVTKELKSLDGRTLRAKKHLVLTADEPIVPLSNDCELVVLEVGTHREAEPLEAITLVAGEAFKLQLDPSSVSL